MTRIGIVGGGIAGLSAAFYLERARRNGATIDWTLFEKSGRLGGVIRSEQHEGFVLEAGPDSFLTAKPAGAQFCRDLGIADQLISSNDSTRKTYILFNYRLIPIPEGLEFMVPTRILPMLSTPLFSWATKARMACELFANSGGTHHQDESVADFVRRHFGQEMVDRVAEPLLAGVYGGNADQMSVRAVLPRFAEMESESGSLVRATLKARKARAKSSALQQQSLFTSLKNGMQEMVNAAAAALPPDSVHLQHPVTAIERCGSGWAIRTQEGTQPFDAVLLAVPAPAAASLLREVNFDLARELWQIEYSSSAAVVMGYDRPIKLPPGHGFLVPRKEGRNMLACTFVHRKFPFRAPEGAALLRCFVSSSRVPELMRTDQWLLSTMHQEIREILAVYETPRFAHIYRWDCALPQYAVGHLERVAKMKSILNEAPGLHIIGNSFHGVGIPDCIRSGKEAAERFVAS
jgi:oxygen-dependent protoporphyrinogen oxidase